MITSSSDEKLARAKAMGADQTINYKATPEWGKAVRDGTGGVGADLIIEVGGGGTIEQSLRAIKIGGHIAIVGVVAGMGSGFNPASLIGNSAKLQGCRSARGRCSRPCAGRSSCIASSPWWTRCSRGPTPRRAFAAMQTGQHFGKIVLEF